VASISREDTGVGGIVLPAVPVDESVIDCTYCGCDVTAHDPVVVSRPTDGDIDEAGLAVGTTCEWTPDG